MRWKSIEEARLARMGASTSQLQEPEPSRWSPDELGLIKYAYPAFKEMTTKPSLNQIVVEFLERYEVYVQPASSTQGRSAGDRLSDGMVGGLAGPAAVAANQGLRGQQQNTAVQEWSQWKQWALDHKIF